MSVEIHARAVLLDMDGTLVDSSAVVERVWTDWALANSLEPAEVLKVVHGRQSHESMALLLPDRSHEETMADNASMVARETAETEGVIEIPGAVALVSALADVPHALVTSATLDLATARMNIAGMQMPALSITAENVSASKPDPEGFIAAATKLGVEAEACVVFEDSSAGIAAARNAGMRVIGVGNAAAGRGATWTVQDLTGVRIAVGPEFVTVTLV
jgi:mannitol-1-/sugar-/sorbitol-6-phosphatase